MANYPEIEVVIPKLRLGTLTETDPIYSELEIYATEIDALLDRWLRKHLGFVNSAGNNIDLPLTFDSTPPIDDDFKRHADNLLIGKFRMETGNGDKLWVEGLAGIDAFLQQKFGWVSDKAFKVRTTITPDVFTGIAGATVTLAGENFFRFNDLTVLFNGTEVITTPAAPLSDINGKFTNIQFNIPTGQALGGYEIKIQDSRKDEQNRPIPNTGIERFQVV